MKYVTIAMLFCSLVFLNACANTGMTKGQQGVVGGAAAGALIGQMIGHNTEATLIGAAVGTMLGYIVGNEMDKYDREQLNHVYARGVSGTSSAWINPDTGNRYSVTPEPAYSNPQSNQPCRKAEIVAIIDGKEERTYTTACRDANGQWMLQ